MAGDLLVASERLCSPAGCCGVLQAVQGAQEGSGGALGVPVFDRERFEAWGGSGGNLGAEVEGAADRKQQPGWVNAVIKALISSAKRERVIDHGRRQPGERRR